MTIKNRFPNQRPDFALDFNNTERIPPGVFSRASTGTYIGSDGLIKLAAISEPRFNYNPITGENLGLLVEEARTNLSDFSQDFSATNWPTAPGTTSLTRTLNAIVAPDGTMTADEIKCISSANSVFALETSPSNTVVDSNAFYTLSIFAKAGGWSRIGIRAGFTASTHRTTVDLTTGVVLNSAGQVVVTPFPNGWYRIAITARTIATGFILILEVHNTLLVQNAEVGDPTDGYIYIWGAQLEKGTSASSYIPTTTTALTRAADIISINNTALPAAIADGGSLFVETTNPSLLSGRAVLSLNDGSAVNELIIRNLSAAGGTSIQRTVSGVTTSADVIGGSNFSQNSFALRIKANDFALAGNSQPIVTASGAVPAFTQIKIGSSFTGGNGFNGTIKRLAFYSDELNNQELQGISAKPGTAPPSSNEPVLYMLVTIETPDFVWNLRSTGTVNYNVDWGDGQTELAQTSNTKEHTYALPGIYKVVVRLNSGSWRPFYNYNADATRISAIAFTGTGWSFGTNLNTAFTNGSNIASIGNINTTGVTDFDRAWQSLTSLESFPVIDTSSGTMFVLGWEGCSSLTSFPLLNTSNGTIFIKAWSDCAGLTSFPLLDFSAATHITNTWSRCSSLTSFPFINTASVIGALGSPTFGEGAWNGCSGLTSFPALNLSGVVGSIAGAWANCTGLTSFPAIDFPSVTRFGEQNQGAWQSCTSLTSFPLIDTSAGTGFIRAWFVCTGLTSFPLINTAAGEDFTETWFLCLSLTSFPALNFSAGTNFFRAWRDCSALTTFPPNLFDSCLATNFNEAWLNCALTAASIENIIVSINAAGTSGGTLSFAGGTNAIKSSWTAPADAAYDALVARGWNITFRT